MKTTLIDEHGVEWTILGAPSDFCGAQYAELATDDGRRTVRQVGMLRQAGYDVPVREVEARPVTEGRCIEWSGEKRDDVPFEHVAPGESAFDQPDQFEGMVEVEPGVFAFADHA